MTEINLQVTIEEANLILEGLGNLPFVKVYALISKIQEQAGQQIKTSGDMTGSDDKQHSAPTIEE